MTSPAFYEWLNVATRGLPAKAAARLRADAEALYTDEFVKALRDGVGQSAARSWAVTVLGDPEVVNRRYLDELSGKSFPVATKLDKWVVVATKDLCAAAKTRVATEVEAHYWEVFRAAKQDGLNDARAVGDAMLALGDAKKARRRFKKIYLTEMEAQIIEAVVKQRSPRQKLRAMLYPMLCILLALAHLFGGPEGLGFAWLGFGTLGFGTILAILIGRRVPRAVVAVQLMLLPFVFVFSFLGLVAMGANGLATLRQFRSTAIEFYAMWFFTGAMGLLLSLAGPYAIKLYFSVFQKLRHKHNLESTGLHSENAHLERR